MDKEKDAGVLGTVTDAAKTGMDAVTEGLVERRDECGALIGGASLSAFVLHSQADLGGFCAASRRLGCANPQAEASCQRKRVGGFLQARC